MATQNLPRPAPGGRLDVTLGITETIAPPTPGWTGELRVRFTDFQVNEISKEGTVVHLKETKLPSPERSVHGALTGDVQQPRDANDGASSKPAAKPQEGNAEDGADKTAEKKPEEKAEAAPEVPEVSEEDKKILTDLTSDTFTTDLIAIYQAAVIKKPIPPPARSPAIEDKDSRSQIHQQVRRIFRSVIDTSTDQSDAGSFIIATGRPPRPSKAYNQKHRTRGGADNNNNRNKNNRRGNKTGPLVVSGEGEYLHFTVYKENRDTMDAAHQLARVLRVKPQSFAFAGTKDRRAATAQRFSVRGLKAEAVLGANPRMHGVVTGDYRYERSPLYLGALQGNEFVITLKNCELGSSGGESHDLSAEAREQAIRTRAEAALASMASRGWLNYYGHQRFGTLAVGTHDIGRLILQSDFEGAVNAVLAYDPAIARRAVDGEEPQEAHLRDELNRHRACMLFREGGSADEALRFLPRRFAAEATLIRHLGRASADGAETSRRDFQGALLTIPRTLRNMYLHAYQSYVWNHAASYRWSQHGDAVVEGDLVLDESAGVNNDNNNEDGDDDDNASTSSRDAATARPLTAADADSGRYTIHDVVLPTPGHSVAYPANATGDFYASFMGRPENGALDPRDMTRRQRDFSLPGNYRRLTARFVGAAAPRVEVRRYARDDEQMHPTDLDRLRQTIRDAQAQAQAAAAGAKRKRPEGEAGEEQEENPDVKKAKTEEAEAEAVPGETKMEVDAPEPTKVEAQADGAEKTKVAVVVHFQLAKSAYATVALRELMGIQAGAET